MQQDPTIELLQAIVNHNEAMKQKLDELAGMIGQSYQYLAAGLQQIAAQLPPPPVSEIELSVQKRIEEMLASKTLPEDPVVIERTYQHLLQQALASEPEEAEPSAEDSLSLLRSVIESEEE